MIFWLALTSESIPSQYHPEHLSSARVLCTVAKSLPVANLFLLQTISTWTFSFWNKFISKQGTFITILKLDLFLTFSQLTTSPGKALPLLWLSPTTALLSTTQSVGLDGSDRDVPLTWELWWRWVWLFPPPKKLWLWRWCFPLLISMLPAELNKTLRLRSWLLSHSAQGNGFWQSWSNFTQLFMHALSIGVFLFGRGPLHAVLALIILLLLASLFPPLPLLLPFPLLLLPVATLQILPKRLLLPVLVPARVELVLLLLPLSLFFGTTSEPPLLLLLPLPPDDNSDVVEGEEVSGVAELAEEDDQLRRSRFVGIKLWVCVHGCIFSTNDGIESHFWGKMTTQRELYIDACLLFSGELGPLSFLVLYYLFVASATINSVSLLLGICHKRVSL